MCGRATCNEISVFNLSNDIIIIMSFFVTGTEFPVTASRIWNSLPQATQNVISAPSLQTSQEGGARSHFKGEPVVSILKNAHEPALRTI